jgi:hypothetical protein
MNPNYTGLNLVQGPFSTTLMYLEILNTPLSDRFDRIPGMSKGGQACALRPLGNKSRVDQSALFFRIFDVRKTTTNHLDQQETRLLKNQLPILLFNIVCLSNLATHNTRGTHGTIRRLVK